MCDSEMTRRPGSEEDKYFEVCIKAKTVFQELFNTRSVSHTERVWMSRFMKSHPHLRPNKVLSVVCNRR